MLNKLVTTFILFTFLASLAGEIEFGDFDSYQADFKVKNNVEKVVSATLHADCEDCANNDCSDCNDHCAHHCNGLHNITPIYNEVSLNVSSEIISKEQWYFSNHYKTPFIDPSLKPPTFS